MFRLAIIIQFAIFNFISHFSFAASLSPKNVNSSEHNKVSEIITNVFYEEIFSLVKDIPPEKLVAPTPKPKKKMTLNQGKRGKYIIEQLKQKNREKLAKMRGFDPDKVKSGGDLIKMQQKDNKEVLKKMAQMEWTNMAKSEIEALKRKVLVEHREWRKKHLARLKNWDLKKKDYLNEVDEYRKTLIEMPLVLPVSKKELKKEVEVKLEREHFIVANALGVNIRDQKRRPTCSSFAGVRAIEILLAQNQRNWDLSEQYFYWASKPKCQKSPCSSQGSWVGYGLTHSKKVGNPDIPIESTCPYRETSIFRNETQLPLAQGCYQGKVGVKSFSMQKNLDEVLLNLQKNRAVMASLKLTPNFYNTKGLVLQKDSYKKGKMNQHAQGHAVLLIGYMKLPRALQEGSVCFITANSWGVGWGNGGYACLSEKWLLKNRSRNPFVAVTQVEI
jgi:C1A family cysteine protease